MRRSFFKIALLIIIGAFAFVGNAFAQWVAPTVPPPGGNTPPPLNTGTVNQIKDANITTKNLQVTSGNIYFGVAGTQSLLGSGGISVSHFSNTNDESYISIKKNNGFSYGQLYGSTAIGSVEHFGLRDSSPYPGPWWILDHAVLGGVGQYTALRVANNLIMTLLSTGNVGINNIGNPLSKLSVRGTGGSSFTNIGELTTAPAYSGISFGAASAPISTGNYSLLGNGLHTILNRPTGGNIDFRENDSTQVRIATGGNVGIGTAAAGIAPENKLHLFNTGIANNTQTNPLKLSAQFQTGAGAPPRPNLTSQDQIGIAFKFISQTGDYVLERTPIRYSVSGVPGSPPTPYALSLVADGGNVGIGVPNPSAKLEVAGQILATGITITGGAPGTGKVLTSNATGLASWASPFSLPTCLNKEYIRYNGVSLAWECTTIDNDLQDVTDLGNVTTTWITASDVQSSVSGKWLSQAVTLAAPCADQEYIQYDASIPGWKCTTSPPPSIYHNAGPFSGAWPPPVITPEQDRVCTSNWPASHLASPGEIDACISGGICNSIDTYWIYGDVNDCDSIALPAGLYTNDSASLTGHAYNISSGIITPQCNSIAYMVCVE